MSKALENAKARLAVLRVEIGEIEHFIELHARFEGGTDGGQENGDIRGNLSTDETHHPVDNQRAPGKRGPRPSELTDMIARILRDVGQPMTRGEIVEALARRDVHIPAQDKPRYIGTIVWRNKSKFINIDGQGYWLRSELQNVRNVPPNTPYFDPPEIGPDGLTDAERKDKIDNLFK